MPCNAAASDDDDDEEEEKRRYSQATANSTFQLVARLVLGINDSDLLENGTLLRSRAQLLIGTRSNSFGGIS